MKLLYSTIRNRNPFFNIFNRCGDFSVQIQCEKIRFFTHFQLQTAIEPRKQHQMTWNSVYKSTFMSATRKNNFKMDIRNIAKIEVMSAFFRFFPIVRWDLWQMTEICLSTENFLWPMRCCHRSVTDCNSAVIYC